MNSPLTLHNRYFHQATICLIKAFALVMLSIAIVPAQSPFPDGTVIADDTGPIWVIINGQKRWIKSPAIMIELGWDKVPLKKISPDVTKTISNGPDLNSAEREARAILFLPVRGQK